VLVDIEEQAGLRSGGLGGLVTEQQIETEDFARRAKPSEMVLVRRRLHDLAVAKLVIEAAVVGVGSGDLRRERQRRQRKRDLLVPAQGGAGGEEPFGRGPKPLDLIGFGLMEQPAEIEACSAGLFEGLVVAEVPPLPEDVVYDV